MTWGDVKRSQRCRRSSQRGLTLIEFVVCLAIMSALVGFTLNRSRDSMELAEKAAMETQYFALRSAMHLRVAKLISTGRTSELASFVWKPLRAMDTICGLSLKSYRLQSST